MKASSTTTKEPKDNKDNKDNKDSKKGISVKSNLKAGARRLWGT